MRQLDKNKIKAVSIDLDGTVLRPEGRLSGYTIDVIKKCARRGISIIVNTGRSVGSAEPYRSVLGAEGLMVYFNGAEVVSMPEKKIIKASLLGNALALECNAIARRHHIHFHVFFSDSDDAGLESLIAENTSEAATFYKNRTGIDFQFDDLCGALSGDEGSHCVKGIFIAPSAELDALRPELNKTFAGKVSIVKSAPELLEILHPAASKGNGLRFVMDSLNLKTEEVIAFGDEENDLSMFGIAGFACAPANARESVKAAADIVIGANSEDGVAAFLEKEILGDSQPMS
jgi:Cof subfamily protein (haloacid dehalogenase superfamily)